MKEFFKYVGKTVAYPTSTGIVFDVIITDLKMSYGDLRFEIKPVSGIGKQWVSISSLVLPKEQV